jgi:Bacterial Ig-like domain (group 3)/FG-GAP-like repeat
LQRFLSLCLLTATALTSMHAETFRNPQLIPTGADPAGLHVADLNNDGLPDLYYFSTTATVPAQVSLHVLLAQTGSAYVPQTPVLLPVNTYANCTPVDVNGDRKMDLVCPNSQGTSQGSILTLLGNGDGTFQSSIIAASFPSSGGNYYAFEILGQGDLNLDGHTDLIVYDALNQLTYILLGDGAGHFAISRPPNVNGGGFVTVADVNNDGKPDLLFNSGAVALGNANGTFSSLKLYGGAVSSCVFQDIDGDGHLDAVCGGVETNDGLAGGDVIGITVLVFMHGNADGSFNTPQIIQQYGSGTNEYQGLPQVPSPFAVQDINHDGIPDVIATTSDGVAIILGQTNLKFANPVYYPSGNRYTQPAFVDMNTDGSPDLVVPGPNGTLITYGHPDGTFDSASVFLSGELISHTAVADFNGDGILDIATAGDAAINLRLGKADGSFAPVTPLPRGTIDFTGSNYLFHGDFNGDGKQDILAAGAPSTSLSNSYVLLGLGDGSFNAPIPVSSSNFVLSSFSSGVADLNQDGRDDAIESDGQNLHVFLAQPNGTLASSSINSPIPQEQVNQYSSSFVFGDFNNDGVPDSIVGLQNIYFLNGKGDGSFASAGPAIAIPQGLGTAILTAMTTGDFDGDDNLDVALLVKFTNGTSAVFIYYGNGDGTFSTAVTAGTFNRSYTNLTIGDLDNDGRSDLVLSYSSNGSNLTLDGIYAVGVVHALINRTFGPEINYTAGMGLLSAVVTDVNHDGFPDLLFSNNDFITFSNSFTILTNIPGPVIARQLTVLPEPSSIGQSYTLTATLTPPTGSSEQQISGPITFFIDRVQVGTANLVNGVASLPLTSTLSLGAHRISASWPGDSSYASLILHATHTVTKIPVTITLSAQPNPATVGQRVNLTNSFANSVSSPSFPITGTYTVLDGTQTIATGTITANGPVLSPANLLLSAGTHVFTANYSGDANHASSSASLNLVVNPAPSTTVLQSTPNPVPYGQPITFTGQVTANVDPATLSLSSSGPGTLTISGLPGATLSLPVTFPASSPANSPVAVTAATTTNIAPGTYSVTATFSGNTNLLSSVSSTLKQVISPPPSVTTITINPSPALQAHTLTLTANVAGVITTPTGSVQFLDGATVLGTVPLAAGTVAFTTTTLAVGPHNLSASYSGDTNNAASASAPVSEMILPYDFSLTFSPSSVSVATGGSTTITITATSIGTFAEGTNFTIGTLPPDATGALSSQSVTLTSGGTATTTLTINTKPTQSATNQTPSRYLSQNLKTALALTLVPVLLPFFRRRRLATLFSLALVCVFFSGMLGCSSKPATTPPGSYTIQITGTSAQTQQTHTVSIPLTVTQ